MRPLFPARIVPPLAISALSLALSACSGAPATPSAPAPPAPLVVAPAAESSLDYHVAAAEGGGRLDVLATLPAGLPGSFHVEREVIRWLENPEVETTTGWSSLPFDGDAWNIAGCERGCRVRYRFDMAGAARASEDADYALSAGSAFVAPPSSWLFHPAREVSGFPFKLRVETAPGASFVTGVYFAEGGEGASYGADVADIQESPYSAFGQFESRRMSFDEGVLDVAITGGSMTGGNATLYRWIDESARAISAYYGKFPIPHASLVVVIQDGSGIGRGSTLGGGGGGILLEVGKDTPAPYLLHEWHMPHEMIHLALPNVERTYHWLEEGTATYVESVARARSGIYTPEEAWKGLAVDMHKGLPQPGEGGLDDTPTWGRTYWGGALFCLLADIRIREQTANKKGLEDALGAVLAQGGNVGIHWTLAKTFQVADKATGTTVLHDLHEELGHKPGNVDLPALWTRLGIRLEKGTVTFDDTAPLAAIRKAIVYGPAGLEDGQKRLRGSASGAPAANRSP